MRGRLVGVVLAAALLGGCTVVVGGAGAGTGALVASAMDRDTGDGALWGLGIGAVIGVIIDAWLLDSLKQSDSPERFEAPPRDSTGEDAPERLPAGSTLVPWPSYPSSPSASETRFRPCTTRRVSLSPTAIGDCS